MRGQLVDQLQVAFRARRAAPGRVRAEAAAAAGNPGSGQGTDAHPRQSRPAPRAGDPTDAAFQRAMDEGRYRVAEGVSFEAQKIMPDSLTPLDATMTLRQIGYLVEALGLRVARQKGVVDALNPVEKGYYPLQRRLSDPLPGRRCLAGIDRPPQGEVQPNGPLQFQAGGTKINKVLHDQTELDFVDTPLADVITYLQDYHKINIAIDHKALEDAGIGTDTQITRTLKGVTLRSALKLMLKDLGLTYVIADEVLLITTPDEANNRLSDESLSGG